jgi:two-component system, chemotaxis family, sensor kinase CheA
VARDQYKYFRIEAREIVEGLGRGTLDLEKGTGGAELVVHMLRLAHTLKGASRVVRQTKIAELAHAIEDLLAPHRERGRRPVSREQIGEVLRLVDEISTSLDALDAPPSRAEAPAPIASEPLKNVRIEIEEVDRLLESVVEANVRLTSIRRDLEDLSRARRLVASLSDLSPPASRARSAAEELDAVIVRAERNLTAGIDHADREIGQIREKAHRLRLMPASVVFAALERGARDAAESLGRTIHFDLAGGDHRLEANLLFALRDALLHVVRNAVAHGIEPEAERLRAGKQAIGRVRLDVQRRGNRIAFVCSDDGRGIDLEKVRRAAIAFGVTAAGEAAGLGPEEVLRLVLESGVSTSEQVTEVSGRGIGLDVLRTTVAQLKGEVSLSSQPGRGTTVDVCVPLSISSIAGVVLEAAGLTASLPLDSVVCALSLAAGDIAHSAERDSVVVDGAVVPFLPLAVALGRATPPERRARTWTGVVIRAGVPRQVGAIGVDRLVGTSSIVLRGLPRLAGPSPVAAGVSLDSEGNPQIVLDPRALVGAAQAGAPSLASRAAAELTRRPILIIDDSLTTRMLEQSILESAGYAVDLATSAEEALAKARAAAYSLFLVDVEMPGMDGFEFVSETRADPALRATPAILVTSRDAAEDRRRGANVGARAYIAKGEFDQGHLLGVIRQLIG